MIYRLLLALASLTTAATALFFLWGLSDGTVGSHNLLLWLALVATVGGLYVAGLRMRAAGSRAATTVLMLLLALPTVLFAMFMLVTMIAPPRWN